MEESVDAKISNGKPDIKLPRRDPAFTPQPLSKRVLVGLGPVIPETFRIDAS